MSVLRVGELIERMLEGCGKAGNGKSVICRCIEIRKRRMRDDCVGHDMFHFVVKTLVSWQFVDCFVVPSGSVSLASEMSALMSTPKIWPRCA